MHELLQIPQLPNPPPDVERNPTLLAEYESIAGQIKSSCHQVALLDRVHNIKVRPHPISHQALPASPSPSCCNVDAGDVLAKTQWTTLRGRQSPLWRQAW